MDRVLKKRRCYRKIKKDRKSKISSKKETLRKIKAKDKKRFLARKKKIFDLRFDVKKKLIFIVNLVGWMGEEKKAIQGTFSSKMADNDILIRSMPNYQVKMSRAFEEWRNSNRKWLRIHIFAMSHSLRNLPASLRASSSSMTNEDDSISTFPNIKQNPPFSFSQG